LLDFSREIAYTLVMRKGIALALLVCFILVSLLSATFIGAHSRHEHGHNGANGSCLVCAQIQNANNLLRQIFSAVSSTPLAYINLFFAAAFLCSVLPFHQVKTLVKLKIQMNN